MPRLPAPEPEDPHRHPDNDAPHILVADDDPDIVESIATALRQKNYRVSRAFDGNQAIAFAETRMPDLIILDLMMPRRSGFIVLERLRQQGSVQTPVIMITGNEGLRHRKYAFLLGVNDYIQKPFTMERLLKSVSENCPPTKT